MGLIGRWNSDPQIDCILVRQREVPGGWFGTQARKHGG